MKTCLTSICVRLRRCLRRYFSQKIKKDVSKTYQINNLKRFRYNEYILHCVRKAVKCNKSIQVI